MTVEERLAEWLEQTTPEPPHAISVDDLHPRAARNRAWLPVLAAACIVAIVIVTVAIAHSRRDDHSAPAISAPPTTAHTSGSPSPSPSAPTSTPTKVVSLPMPAWGARVVGQLSLISDSTFSDGNRLFGLNVFGGATSLVRIDPTSGQVVARHPFPSDGLAVRSVIVAAGRIWTVVRANGNGPLTLEAYNPSNLAPQGVGVVLPVPGNLDRIRPVLGADGATIFVGAGSQVFVVDGETHAITSQMPFERQEITAVTVASERLYVGTGSGAVLTTDLANGADLAPMSPGGAVTELAATERSLWIHSAGGHVDDISWTRLADRKQVFGIGNGGGGAYPTLDLIGSTVWLGGPDDLVCADPDTGKVRAKAPLSHGQGYEEDIGGIAIAGGRVFATAEGTSLGKVRLVELHPPAKCTP